MTRMANFVLVAMFLAVAEPRAFVLRYLDPRTWTTWLTLDDGGGGLGWTRAACSLQCQSPNRSWCNIFALMDDGAKCALARMSGLYLEDRNDADGSLLEVYMDEEDLRKRFIRL